MIFLELGPAFVKIAQAVSSRSDVIPPAYLEELSLLQDRIAPFSTEIAFDTIEKELELPLDVLFSEISPEPVAAASLGQVYQARLYTSGKLVAVKVQRPGVQAAISLDIFILRFLAGLLKRAAKLNTDLQVRWQHIPHMHLHCLLDPSHFLCELMLNNKGDSLAGCGRRMGIEPFPSTYSLLYYLVLHEIINISVTILRGCNIKSSIEISKQNR